MATYTVLAYLPGTMNVVAQDDQGLVGWIDSRGRFSPEERFLEIAVLKQGYRKLPLPQKLDEDELKAFQAEAEKLP